MSTKVTNTWQWQTLSLLMIGTLTLTALCICGPKFLAEDKINASSDFSLECDRESRERLKYLRNASCF